MRLDRKPWFEVTEAGLTWPAKYFSAEACFHPNDAYDLNHFPSIFLHFYMMHMTWKHDHLPYIFLHFSRLLEMLFMEILSFNSILELNTWQIGPYWAEEDDIICAALKVLLCRPCWSIFWELSPNSIGPILCQGGIRCFLSDLHIFSTWCTGGRDIRNLYCHIFSCNSKHGDSTCDIMKALTLTQNKKVRGTRVIIIIISVVFIS